MVSFVVVLTWNVADYSNQLLVKLFKVNLIFWGPGLLLYVRINCNVSALYIEQAIDKFDVYDEQVKEELRITSDGNVIKTLSPV